MEENITSKFLEKKGKTLNKNLLETVETHQLKSSRKRIVTLNSNLLENVENIN